MGFTAARIENADRRISARMQALLYEQYASTRTEMRVARALQIGFDFFQILILKSNQCARRLIVGLISNILIFCVTTKNQI